jgi:hypothetical protein
MLNGSPRRLRRLGALLLKLLVSLTILVLGLEIGTRLLLPVDRFEVLPNTFDAQSGVRPIPHGRGFVRCSEYAIAIRINGAGLREDREYPLARAAGHGRILCLGDSFTFGLGVTTDATFAKRLERRLGGADEVLNAGIVGTGTAEQLAWYAAYGRNWRPDLVVLAFCVNDWTDNTKSGLFTLAPDSTLVQHPAIESRTLRWLRLLRRVPGYDGWFSRSHFVNRFRHWYAVRHHGRLEAEAAGGQATDEVWRTERALAEALLQRLREVCAADGTDLLVMPVPALPGSGEAERRIEELLAFLAREGFARLDLRDAFARAAAEGDTLHFPIDGHWTEAGHRVVASELERWLGATGRAAGR